MMKQVLPQLILEYMSMHPARASLMSQMILGTMQTRDVQLKRLGECIDGSAYLASKTRRIQVFFKEQEIDMVAGGKLIKELLKIQGKYKLIVDGTVWLFGKEPIHYLVASVVVGKTAIPIAWILLDKKGPSSTEERKELFKIIFQIFSPEEIECAIFDREFVGQDWFEWLREQKAPFIVRLKENFLVSRNGKLIPFSVFFSQLKINEEAHHDKLALWGKELNIAAKRLEDDTLLILASNSFPADLLCELYRDRWSIETGFKNLKSNGFDLEKTHMTNPAKLSKLMLILAIAFVIALKTGIILAKKNL